MIYVYPEKNLRAYPGVERGSQEWEDTYKIRVNVEKSINHFKDSFCIANRKIQNEKTLHADLLLAGITQLDQFIIYCICSCTYYNYLAAIRIQNMIRITQQCGGNIVFFCYCLDNIYYRTRICIYKYLHFLLKSISYQLPDFFANEISSSYAYSHVP